MATTIRFQLRGDIAENWESRNPVLLKNEPGYDITNRRLKLGDGVHAWNELGYIAPDMINDLISGGVDKALSAEQGKVLSELIETKGDNYRRYVVHNQGGTANLDDNKEPSGVGNTIIIPEGVSTVYISGCGAGGGLSVFNNQYIAGYDAGFCMPADFSVNPGDELLIKVGVGGSGQTVIKDSSGDYVVYGSSSRGQDSVVTLNGEEILRLPGGPCGGGASAETLDTVKMTQHAGSHVVEYENPTFNYVDLPLYIYSISKGWTSNSDYNYFMKGFKSAITPFAPYGLGGSFCNFNAPGWIVTGDTAYQGSNGLIIVEFGFTHMHSNGTSWQ